MRIKQTLCILSLLLFTSIQSNALEWDPPVEVSEAVPDASEGTKIVVDPNNNAAIAWVQGGEVYTSYKPFDGDWESPTNHTKGSDPQINIDDSGNQTLLFLVTSASDTIVAKFRPTGGSWGSPDTLATSAGAGDYKNLSLSTIDTNFYGYAAWYDENSGGGSIVKIRTVHRRLAGSGTGATGWDTTIQTVNSGVYSIPDEITPIIRTLSNGNGTVITRLLTVGSPDIYASTTTTPGGAWPAAPINLNFAGAGSAPTTDFDFDMRPNGNAIVACTTSSSPIDIYAASTANPSASWNTAVLVLSTPVDDKGPSVGVDDVGITQVVFLTIDGGNTSIVHSSSTASSNIWPASATNVSLDPLLNVREPQISVTPNGFGVIGWLEDPVTLKTRSSSSGTVNTDGPYTVDTNLTSNTFSVAASDSAKGFASWIDNGSLNGYVESTGTNLPDDTTVAVDDLIRALGKKRLIYQKGLYP